jgi:isopropylmalate/homocitrate/citramalate synthase
MAGEMRQGPAINDTIREVQGIFPSDAALQDAIGRLTRAGFDRAALSLPSARPAATDATPSAGAENPNTEDDTVQSRTLHSSMAASVGAMVGAGVTVATGGAAAVAALAALGLGAASGGVVAAAHGVADAVQRHDRDAAAAKGELVLSAAAPDDAAVQRARAAMQEAGALRVEAVSRTGGALA